VSPTPGRRDRCWRCKGRGVIRPVNYAAAVATLGMSALMQKLKPSRCPVCYGQGWLP